MANKIESLLEGVGSISAVTQALRADYYDNGGKIDDIDTASSALQLLLATPAGGNVARALCCSVLNTAFDKMGTLYMAKPDGAIASEYINATGARKHITNLMSD